MKTLFSTVLIAVLALGLLLAVSRARRTPGIEGRQ